MALNNFKYNYLMLLHFKGLTRWSRSTKLICAGPGWYWDGWPCPGFNSRFGKIYLEYIASHPGQLSLAIPPWVGAMSTSQRAVMPFGWGVKAVKVCEWVAGKTVWSRCYHGPYLSTLAMGSSHNRALYKCPITLLYFTLLAAALQTTRQIILDRNLIWFTVLNRFKSFCLPNHYSQL